MRGRGTIFLVVILGGCAVAPGSAPHDMGAAEHAAAAAKAEGAAHAHEAEFDPARTAHTTVCPPPVLLSGDSGSSICWTSTRNPTQEHLREAQRLHRMAADHRAAAEALRDAEARACGRVSSEDREVGPFLHPEDITGVEPLLEGGHVRGVRVGFAPVEGLTEASLRRLVECHVARNAALGHPVDAMPDCPLVPDGIEADVRATDVGLVVEIESDDTAVAEEVLARARRAAARGMDRN